MFHHLRDLIGVSCCSTCPNNSYALSASATASAGANASASASAVGNDSATQCQCQCQSASASASVNAIARAGANPASVRVQVQSGSSRLEYITWLKWQDIQPINIVKTYAENLISGCSETTVRSLIRLGSISPNRFPGIKVLKNHRRLIKAV